ncbi:DUF4270 family protein [Bacteroidota bacterium]
MNKILISDRNFFSKKNSCRFFIAAIIFSIISGFYACKKENTIGMEILPDDEKIQVYFDSSTVFSVYTFSEDSLTAFNQSYGIIGSYVDPVFGKAKAEFVSQVRLSSSHVIFGNNVEADSLILYFNYGILIGDYIENYYGDTTTLQEFRVYELTESIYKDSVYYSNLNIENYFTEENQIGSISFTPEPRTDTLSIPLSVDLANRLLSLDSVSLVDNDGFLNSFKGIYIATDFVSDDGAILYFDVLSGKTKMTLYYSSDTVSGLEYDFWIDDKSSRINLFSHDYLGTVVENHLNDTLNEAEKVYIQSMSGTKAFMKMELSEKFIEIADQGININKAELIIHIADDPTSEDFRIPGQLFLTAVNAIGEMEFIDDFFVSTEHFDGSYNSSEKVYKFNIALYLNSLYDPDISKRKDNLGFYLFPSFNRVTANRLIIDNNKSGNKIELNIVYSDLK